MQHFSWNSVYQRGIGLSNLPFLSPRGDDILGSMEKQIGDGISRRILILTNALTGGGIERVAYEHARLLAQEPDYEIAVALCDARPDLLPGVKQYALRDFRKANRLLGVLSPGFNAREMRACLNEFSPDVVHIHAYVQFSPGAMAALFRYKAERGCKVVLAHHTYAYVCPNDALFDYRRNEPCQKCIGTRGASILSANCYGSMVVSIGKYFQKYAFRRVFQRGLIDVHTAAIEFVRNVLRAHDPNLDVRLITAPCFSEVLPQLPAKNPGKAVCFGRLSREKNMLAAAKAISGKTGIALTIIGNGPAVPELRQFLQESGASNITFVSEFLEHAQMFEQIMDAQYFIMPSLCFETFGVALIEALNLGMTPLVSDRGSMRELVGRFGVGYTFGPSDIDSIAAALELAQKNRASDESVLAGPVREKLEAFTAKAYLRGLQDLYATLRA